MASKKSTKENVNEETIDVNEIGNEAKGAIDKILGDISKTSATKQLLIGAASGWCTGYISMKVGKMIGLSIGASILLTQYGYEKGFIKINWNKVNNKLDKVSDIVEEKILGEGPNWMDKMERFVDRKLDKAEGLLRNKKQKAKHWYSSILGEDDQKLKEVHIFLLSFVAGVAVGIATS